MTPQQLKNSILQRAIEGKLVEQRPEEGTAKELLKDIKLEKEKLIKEGKIKKSKSLPPINEDEIPFDIPDTWEWVRLGDLINLLSGQDFSPDKYSDIDNSGIPYITGASSLSETEVIVSRWTKEPRCIVEKGDLLLVCKGSGYGKTVICNIKNAHIARQIMALKSEILNLIYVKYFLQYNIKHIKKQGQGIIPGIDRNLVLNMVIPLPPLSEQHRIVAKIKELMPLVDQYDKAYSQLTDLNEKFPQDMKKSILQYAIEGKLVEQRPEEGTAKELLKEIKLEKEKLIKEGKIKKSKPLPAITEDEIPFDIPDGWEWCRFAELVSYSMGKTPPRKEEKYWDSDVKWVSISDMCNESTIKETKESISQYAMQTIFKNQIVSAGTLLMSFKLSIGKVSILEIDAVHNEAIISIYPIINTNNIMRDYLFKILPLIAVNGDFKTAIKGKTLNSSSINNLLIPLPPLAEQKRIVAKIEQLLPLCDKLVALNEV